MVSARDMASNYVQVVTSELRSKHEPNRIQWGLQSNRTINWTEHWAVLQRPQVPVILVFQSVCFSSKRQKVLPPLEMVVQGLFVPGALATRQPAGIGTRHA